MRRTIALTILASLTLAACGSEDASETGDGAAGEPMEMDAVADQMGNAEMPEPGQYRSTQELLELDVPGMDPQFADMLRSSFAEGANEESTYCLTPEEAANGREQMLSGMAESNCTISRFDVSGNTIDAAMACPTGEGLSGDVTITGTMDSTSANMVMSFTAPIPQMGDASIRMRVQSERIGECSE